MGQKNSARQSGPDIPAACSLAEFIERPQARQIGAVQTL
jgi:hypothetical protein